MADIFETTPDARQSAGHTTDSPFRKRYRQLSADEVALHDQIKDTATALFMLYEQVRPSRELSLGKTKLEESVMWAVKGLTA